MGRDGIMKRLDDIEFLTRRRETLFGIDTSYEDASYIVFGAPYDLTSSFRIGSRYGPESIRRFSANIELSSFSGELIAEGLRLHDIGDIHFCYKLSNMLRRVKRIVRAIRETDKIPIMLGGEHTLTLAAALEALRDFHNPTFIVFDAHFDLRREYLDLRINHATYLYHLINYFRNRLNVIVIGVRAYSSEELLNARDFGVKYFTAEEILEEKQNTYEEIRKHAVGERVYLSFDVDVLDPSFAAGVGNPEPGGLSLYQLLKIIRSLEIPSSSVVGIDVMEVSPPHDNGSAALSAAKIILETLTNIQIKQIHHGV